MIRSPRQALAGASAEARDASAAATPSMAMRTPTVLRPLQRARCPSTAPTTMVISGKVDSARVPRATVV